MFCRVVVVWRYVLGAFMQNEKAHIGDRNAHIYEMNETVKHNQNRKNVCNNETKSKDNY